MNIAIILRLVGAILCTEGCALLLSLGAHYCFGFSGPDETALEAFGISSCIALGFGVSFIYLGARGGARLFRREAFCVIGLGWIAVHGEPDWRSSVSTDYSSL